MTRQPVGAPIPFRHSPPRVLMLLSNEYRPDPRVEREALTLAAAGCQVTVLAWDRTGRLPPQESRPGISVERIRIPSVYGTGIRQAARFGLFWYRAIQVACRSPWAAVHAHDFDTIPPALLIARFVRCPVVFDAHECFSGQLSDHSGRLVGTCTRWAEAVLLRRVSHIIAVGERLGRFYQRRARRPYTVVGNNYPNVMSGDDDARSSDHIPVQLVTARLIVGYFGGLHKQREIESLLSAMTTLQDVVLLIAGDGPDRDLVRRYAALHPNIVYLGLLPQSEVKSAVKHCNALYYGLRPGRNNEYSVPNALGLALAGGKPLITTDIGEVADIVRNEGCGIVLPVAPAAEDIRQALLGLTAARLSQMGAHAVRAYHNSFSADVASARLRAVYAKLGVISDEDHRNAASPPPIA